MINYYLYSYSEAVDFKEGNIPNALHFSFGDQLGRARRILNNRSNSEIQYALESIDWLLRKGGDWHFYETITSDEEYFPTNRVKALRCLVDKVDLIGQEDFPNAAWGEYFAVLTIAYVVEAMYELEHGEEHLPATPNNRPRMDMTEYGLNFPEQAIEAMDAISYAEGLLAVDSARKYVHKTMGKKGGMKRVAPYNQLKNKICTIYKNKYTNLSNQKAAKSIWTHDLSETDREVLVLNDDPEHQIAVWIGRCKHSEKV